MKNLFLLLLLFPSILVAQGRVDTIAVYSPSMKKTLKAAISFPAGYENGESRYPVVYLLHGGSGAFSDWHQKVTEKGIVNQLAEEHKVLIVTPGVGPASYYYDSPLLDSVRYETYMIQELIPFIDKNYRTLAQKESRAITGLSMGGHGAITLAAKHPSLFIAAGSMSGVMNIDTDLQWAFWDGIRHFYQQNEAYLQAQLGNPEGAEKPNKKYYDPRVWLRKAEESFSKRLEIAFEDLNCINRNA